MAEKKQAEAPKNKVKIKDAGPCKKKVTIEIPAEAITTATDGQYESLRKEAEVAGFRKGRAPRRLLEKKFGKQTSEQVKLQLLAEASDAAIKDNELNLLRDPDIDYENIELPEAGPLKFEFEIEVRPEFDLPKLEGIPVDKTKLEVSDEQVSNEIDQLQKYSGVWAPRNEGKKVEAEDQVVADAILNIEDVEEAEKHDNIEIHVRENGFVGAIPIEKLDEVLIGAKVGDVKKTSVKVPETYFKEDYRGKKVDAEITIKDIKWLKPADLNEDFFSKFGVGDLSELQDRISDSLQGRLEQQSKQEMAAQVYKYMLDKTKFDLPTNIVAEQAGSLLQRQYTNLIRQGLTREQLEEQMEKLRAGSEQQAIEQLKTFFIMDKVAEKLEIDISDEELNGQIAMMAIQQGQRPEKMKEDMTRNGTLSQFSMQIREDKCIAKILESAKITEIAPKKAKKSVKKTAEKKQAKKAVKKAAKKTAKKTDKKTTAKTPKKAVKKKKTTKKK